MLAADFLRSSNICMAWGSALWRRMKVFAVALTVFLDYRAVRRRVKWNTEKKGDLWERAHKRNADRVFVAITELEGLWVKAGQYLSTRADVLPEAYISSFRQLQDSLPPRPLFEVYKTIESQLGKPVTEFFLEFVNEPLATASIAQVHRARLKDGRDVVVKVQHEGIKECILQDLHNARTVVDWIAWAEPEYDFGPMLDEWCKEVPKELDFNLEAENTRKVSYNLSSWKKEESDVDAADVLVPEIVQSTEKVLILTYMDGVRLNDAAGLDSLGVDKQRLMEAITRAYAHQIYIDGFFNADPHPGNFLVSKEYPHRPILLDFGLTKTLSPTVKQALAKMLLASAEGDFASLLSAFAEMGLKLRLDMPEEAMEITNFFFRRSLPAKESVEEMKVKMKEVDNRKQKIKDKMKPSEGSGSKNSKSLLRSPVEAFPTDAVFFMRVLGLLRGLSSMLDTQVVYIEIMRPYAEAALWSGKMSRDLKKSDWIWDSPVQSHAEEKLRDLLLQMGRNKRILGIQVCAYKDGKVIVDTCAGVHGKYDPRPVRPDTLFPVFSATKGVTAALVHWVAEQGKISLRDRVSQYWPEFAAEGKAACTVAHVLNHTSGLQTAGFDLMKQDPLAMCKWDEMLRHMAAAAPQSLPGQEQMYHPLSFGWLCGGIIEKCSGRKFQELLDEVFVERLGVSGEFYIGIPPGVEDRLASLSLDTEEVKILNGALSRYGEEISSSSFSSVTAIAASAAAAPPEMRIAASMMSNYGAVELAALPGLFNMLFVRRAIIPAANGHFSARALARFYAMLASGGIVPTSSSSTQPPLGSHPHRSSSATASSKDKNNHHSGSSKNCCKTRSFSADFTGEEIDGGGDGGGGVRVFCNDDIFDAMLGSGKYSDLVAEGEVFGLGFRKLVTDDNGGGGRRRITAFGHSGVGGCLGYCDPENNFAIAITVNKMSLGKVSGEIVNLICSEIGISCPSQYATLAPSLQ